MVWELVKRAAMKWSADDCLTLGAALAYYTVFSLAPILVIVIAVAGAVFGQEAAQGEIVSQIRGLVGEEGATAIQSLIESAGRQGAGGRATLIGLLVLLFGSTSAFSQLQGALNKIWEVEPVALAGVWDVVRARFLSFAAVLGTGFLLSVSLVPRYNPITSLPTKKSPAVTPAPSHTSRHRIAASGSSLKIMANSRVCTSMDPRKSASSTIGPMAGSRPHP